MLHAPLPNVSEYDPLDDHLEDLEEPGTNLLGDFILRPHDVADLRGVSNETPLSISNGYTSEESEYSVTTPSDEQMYSDMSFLQTADTSELVEVVADFVKDHDLTALSPQQQQVFAGKMIKGKTSKYRGVTQTSKTSWGAKYSAKRITNTCKTPDEAARAYDEYLKSNHPEKYAKFANFCVRCDRFVNPLGLAEFRNECCCEELSDKCSTEAESPPPVSETDEEAEDKQTSYIRAGSNLSIGSLKLSFLEDSEPLFDDETLLPADPFAADPNAPTMIKKESFTLASVESFTNDGSLDRIIKDIGRSSLPKRPSFTHGGSSGHLVQSGASTLVDFSPEEWQNLSEYLLSEDPQMTAEQAAQQAMAMHQEQQQQSFQQQDQQRPNYKKIHSLDFDCTDNNGQAKDDYTTVVDVDDIASTFMPPPSMSSSSYLPPPQLQTHSSHSFPARVEIHTPFLEKYWRNDRKNIQCFPYCPEHGDYYRVRIENLQHRCKGVCRAAVKAHVTIPTNQPIAPAGLLLLARCNSTFSRNEALVAQQVLSVMEIKNLQTVSAAGMVDNFGVLPDGSGVQFEVTFYPDVWKFEFDLPKKRRHGGASDADFDNTSEFMYFFEIDIFYSTEKTTFERLGHAESMNFQIGNTRTLLRQRNRMTEEPTSTGDSDRVLGAEALPEKKKVKMYMGQLARNSTIGDDTDNFDPALASSSYITGEGLPSKGTIHTTGSHVDVDALCRLDSKDSSLVDADLEKGRNYGRFESPKGGKNDVATEHAMKASAVAALNSDRQQPLVSEKSMDSHSWSKLISYGFVSIPFALLCLPVAWFSLLAFIVIPPLSTTIIRIFDALSDMDLRRANNTCILSDARYVLNRLEMDSSKKGLFKYHSDGAVWTRFIYFGGAKLVISVVMFVPALVVVLAGIVLYPLRPASTALLGAATSMVLVSRNYTRTTVGKPFIVENHDALV